MSLETFAGIFFFFKDSWKNGPPKSSLETLASDKSSDCDLVIDAVLIHGPFLAMAPNHHNTVLW